ncbi:ankyrin repeat domain-containing protein [Aspergillus saccharolyticus JOP 1030-1]|uniref:protein S-acyltransferase n=1 Tax=Aspergillus saccharolyticus JOP 1030-1 TaxID=1450539 RepID=A0A318ZBV4_9EURO|nr:ankyrin [Aspergillus saccharolyticus JOP 1030-1]PYH44905.1 ankyrin [Aspergillus saccharolyticus JOP 1030-1]
MVDENDNESVDLALRFFQDERKVSGIAQILVVAERVVDIHDFPADFLGIHYASYLGLTGIVRRLLMMSEDVDVIDSYRRTPLSWAAENGHEAVLRLLLGRGAGLYLEEDPDWTLVSSRRIPRHIQEVSVGSYTLLTTDASLNATDMLGRTPLSWDAKEGHTGVVRLLLAKGAKAHLTDTMGRKALLLAADHGHEAAIRALLEIGATELDSADLLGQTPLSRASKEGHDAVVQVLLSVGVTVHPADAMGRTPVLGGHGGTRSRGSGPAREGCCS